MRDGFFFYKEWAYVILMQPENIRLEVYDAIIQYTCYGRKLKLSPVAEVAFQFCKQRLDADIAHMAQISSKRSRSGQQGGAPLGNVNALKRVVTAVTESLAEGDKREKRSKTSKTSNKIEKEKRSKKEKDKEKKYFYLSPYIPLTANNQGVDNQDGNTAQEDEKQTKQTTPFIGLDNLEVLAYMVLGRNLHDACCEMGDLIAYNTLKDVKWECESLEKRLAAAKLWKPRRNKSPRYTEGELTFWSKLLQLLPSAELTYMALQDKVCGTANVVTSTYTLTIPEELSAWIEDNLSVTRPLLLELLSGARCDKLNYKASDYV